MARDIRRKRLDGKLPLRLPQPCPICGAAVFLEAITEWGSGDGLISSIEYECETEPEIDSVEWRPWHRRHYAMPYVDWLPWETRVLHWLNRRYYYRGTGGRNG